MPDSIDRTRRRRQWPPRQESVRTCAHHGCGVRPRNGPLCKDHKPRAPRATTAHQRGYDRRWRATSAAYRTAHPRCQHPGCHQPATEVDHIDGLGPNGPRGHDWTNLRGLCKPHHSQRTARDQPGGWYAKRQQANVRSRNW